MEQKASKTAQIPPEQIPTDDGNVYFLKKRRPGCTGMFWRADPTGTQSLASNNERPRDGGSQGECRSSQGRKVGALHPSQATKRRLEASPVGAAMPFEYDNHY